MTRRKLSIITTMSAPYRMRSAGPAAATGMGAVVVMVPHSQAYGCRARSLVRGIRPIVRAESTYSVSGQASCTRLCSLLRRDAPEEVRERGAVA
ncbi:hypothetical protein GCM10007198_09400 [Microbacterium aerolatum]|nr:hypothetical protein GCM10007198_09400 [Microbacterium aerolatum]